MVVTGILLENAAFTLQKLTHFAAEAFEELKTVRLPSFLVLFTALPYTDSYANSSVRRDLLPERARRFELLASSLGKRASSSMLDVTKCL